jgi:hypothetical protein
MRALIVLALLAGHAAADPCKPAASPMRLSFKGSHSVAELVAWIGKHTCKQVEVAAGVPQHDLTVAILAPREYTLAQAEKLVVTAIEATGLKVTSQAKKLRVEHGTVPKDCQSK